MARGTTKTTIRLASASDSTFDWKRIAEFTLLSRQLDFIEESELVPNKQVLYQFSARGHDVTQIMLAALLDHPKDCASAYYRSRPLLLALGLSAEDGFSGPLMRSGGFSDGRDIGVVCNMPSRGGATVIPMSGDVGSQFTPAAGWAQAIRYRREVLKDGAYEGAIACVLFGDGSVATSGFWSALTIATTQKLPVLFYLEDNGFGISVPSTFQTPGGNAAANLASFQGLKIFENDGMDLSKCGDTLRSAVDFVRASGAGPALIRITVPRLSGHSGQDTQSYKPAGLIEAEKKRDPLLLLRDTVVPTFCSETQWEAMEQHAQTEARAALAASLARPDPSVTSVYKYKFYEPGETQTVGGLLAEGRSIDGGTSVEQAAVATDEAQPRVNMVAAIRKTLDHELSRNDRLVVFGEDVGPKGGVHAVTLGLQEKYGDKRVFDTSLSEEGIIGRAVGMALAGLMPVAEIQFRKYADPATEQLHNIGTMRWRTANRFASPMVVRMPGGFAKVGDPWHSVCDEVMFAHSVGWRLAFPSNATDAVGLLRSAMRGNDPVVFFEHRNLLDNAWARRPYPGDEFVVPFGKATILQNGSDVTIVSWGAMVERSLAAAQTIGGAVEVIDLRTISPWDREAVFSSVKKTRRLLIVHEDGATAGFGAEIAACVSDELFMELDAPIKRLAVGDIPIPHNIKLMDVVVPSVSKITDAARALLAF